MPAKSLIDTVSLKLSSVSEIGLYYIRLKPIFDDLRAFFNLSGIAANSYFSFENL